MTIEFSRRLAVVFAIATAGAETIRRVDQFLVPAFLGSGQPGSAGPPWYTFAVWPFWLDDYILAGFLLYAARRTRRDAPRGRHFLAAAWALACGLFYPSFFSQLTVLDTPYEGPIPGLGVAVLKGIALIVTILGLIITLRYATDERSEDRVNSMAG